MTIPAVDPRVVRTRAKLRRALIQLAAERKYSAVSVQDVARAAGVNRTTFYLHYTGIPGLLEDCAQELFAEMRAEIYAHAPVEARFKTSSLEPFVEAVFRHLQRYHPFYRAMLGKQGDPYFRALFQDLLTELIFEPILAGRRNLAPDPRWNMVMRFFCDGFSGVAAWWLEGGMSLPPEAAARLVARDILPGYIHLMQSDQSI